jgi:hypothetical protein
MNLKSVTLLFASGLTSLFLQACAPPVRVLPSKPLVVTKTVYATVDPKLTAPCDPSTPRAQALKTNGTLLQAWIHDSAGLDKCGARVDGIRALQKAPPSEKSRDR